MVVNIDMEHISGSQTVRRNALGRRKKLVKAETKQLYIPIRSVTTQ